ncbi:ABC transporter permease [Ferviditalea candida]|uniref:ABC transporter permease n=1 Tax=Ferviditalea candida TaxID=3108399 RepID=A0ABU5ZDQ9_9BACL|nr:ABC transporter permease [Paenibacillaceae bacterium T2]
MPELLLRKFLSMLLSLFVLITATFFLMKAIPGDPFSSAKQVPDQVRAHLYAHYGLDKPVWEQYWIYLGHILHGDLGMSMKQQYQSVNQIIGDSFVPSFELGVGALIVSAVIGVWFGMAAALHHRKAVDTAIMIFAVIGLSVPSFVLASIFQYYLGVKLHWFAVAGLRNPIDYVLPTITLAALPTAFIARLTRASMLEVLNADFIRTAKAKGLNRTVIAYRHALRNALLPVLSYFGPLTANVITGSVIVESMFGIGGLGKYFVYSISNRDYPVIMGITIFYAAVLMAARFLTDAAYMWVDPRIKLSGGKESSR